MRSRASIVLLATGLALLTGCSKHRASDSQLAVAAAADLTAAFTELGDAFAARTGVHPSFTFGSTGLLTKQLEQGAPFDVFAAANVSYADEAVNSGACDGATKAMYARGRIVVWWRKGATVTPPTVLSELGDPRFVHVAIANPDHAPYGHAAKEALGRAGVLDAVTPKLVYGENVQQALQSASTGNADVAIVAFSLAIRNENGAYLAIDPSMHAPIDQAMVVCRNGKNAALGKQFSEFVGSPSGRAVMQRYGFLLPGETVAAAP